MGHLCLHCHEQDAKFTEAFSPRSQQTLPAALIHGPHSVAEIDLALNGRARRHVVPVLLLVLVLAAGGCALPAFTVTLSCPLGVFSEATHSVGGFAQQLPGLSEEPNSFSARFSQLTYLFFMIVIIHAHAALLLVVWLVKLTPSVLATANTVAHMLFAWSALDVGVISMVATLIEMSSSDFVQLTSDQKALLSRLAGRDVSNEQGLKVNITLSSGTLLLTLAALLQWWLGRAAMGHLRRAVLAQEVSVARSQLLSPVNGEDISQRTEAPQGRSYSSQGSYCSAAKDHSAGDVGRAVGFKPALQPTLVEIVP